MIRGDYAFIILRKMLDGMTGTVAEIAEEIGCSVSSSTALTRKLHERELIRVVGFTTVCRNKYVAVYGIRMPGEEDLPWPERSQGAKRAERYRQRQAAQMRADAPVVRLGLFGI